MSDYSETFDPIAPTPERMEKNGGVIVTQGTDGNRYRAAWENPLDAYYALNAINKEEYEVGLKFHQAYYGTALFRGNDCSGAEGSLQDKLLKQAYKDLPGMALDTVVDVCGHSQPVKSLRALETLRIGLGHLTLLWNRMAIEVCEHKRD